MVWNGVNLRVERGIFFTPLFEKGDFSKLDEKPRR
jgi:hypothetical protein